MIVVRILTGLLETTPVNAAFTLAGRLFLPAGDRLLFFVYRATQRVVLPLGILLIGSFA